MATTAVTLNGTTYFIPQPGERGVTYDQDLTNYLIALATAFPQGGTNPSSTFQALISAGANPATAGRIRLAFADLIEWRNFANTGNLILDLVNGGATNGDNLAFVDAAGNTNLLTGRAYAEYTTTAAQSIPNGTVTVINYGTVVTDTDSAVTTGAAWHFTVPAGKGGKYLVSATASFGSAQTGAAPGREALYVERNGAIVVKLFDVVPVNSVFSSNSLVAGTALISVVAGDLIDVRIFQNSGAGNTSIALTAVASDNRITIEGPF